MPTSSWATFYGTSTDQPATRLSYDEEASNAVIYGADTTANYTHLSGTDTVDDTSWVRTDHYFNGLEDTVVLLNANRGTDFNLSGVLWKFALETLAPDASSDGRFTDLFASVAGNTVTIREFSKFQTVICAMSGITISVGTSIYTDETGGTFTHSRTSYNGIFYPTVTEVSMDTDGVAHNYTLPPVMTVPDFRKFVIAGVESTLSTYYTETDHTSPAVSLTLFTHTVQTSEYRRSDSSWITGSQTATWVSATSSTFARDARHQAATTTHRVSFRGTTTDEILASKFSVTGTITEILTDDTGGTTGLGTYAVYLGMQKMTTTRVISLERTDTISTHLASLHRDLRQYTSFFEANDTAHLGGTDGTDEATYEEPDGSGGSRTQSHQAVHKSFFSEIWADEIFVTIFDEHRLGPSIYGKPLNFNSTEANRAVFRVLPVGWAGFGGSFEASSLTVCRTTTEGLLAGSTFSSNQKVWLDGSVSAAPSVSMMAVHSGITIGGGAESASLISTPSAMTSVVSIAVTWTSTTQTGSATSQTAVTSHLATHTLAVTDPIIGDFWTSVPMTIDNGFRTGLDPDGSFAGVVGFGLGANVVRSTYQVILDAGYVAWTEYSGQQSTAGAGGSSSGSNGSVSFAVPWSHAIVFRAENMLTAKWERGAQNDNYFFSLPYLPAEP